MLTAMTNFSASGYFLDTHS